MTSPRNLTREELVKQAQRLFCMLLCFFYGEIDIYLLDKEYLKERIAFHKVKFQESLSLTERT